MKQSSLIKAMIQFDKNNKEYHKKKLSYLVRGMELFASVTIKTNLTPIAVKDLKKFCDIKGTITEDNAFTAEEMFAITKLLFWLDQDTRSLDPVKREMATLFPAKELLLGEFTEEGYNLLLDYRKKHLFGFDDSFLQKLIEKKDPIADLRNDYVQVSNLRAYS
ncbi:MAG: hypothetical protein H0W64_11670 [Gammaproteobacteria bacterium]|nr:hypothetical protein [Gammaproteobacteria bacterium]